MKALATAAYVLAGLVPATAAHAAVDPLTERAVRAFGEICLANAASLEAARNMATGERWAFKPGQSLPRLTGRGSPMETYQSDNVSLLLRSEKNGGFGCLVTYELAGQTTNEEINGEISKLPSLVLLNGGKGKSFRASWRPLTAAKGSKVTLTVYDMAPRAPLIALESKGRAD